MQADSVVVLLKNLGEGRDLLPLWTGLLGGAIGLGSTYVASRLNRAASTEQIVAQREIAKAQLQQQADATNRQLTATVVAANRVQWIDKLRSEVAAFVASGLAAVTDVVEAKAERASVAPKIDSANHHMAVVTMLLNYDEQDGKDLVTAMEDFTRTIDELIKNGSSEDPYARIDAHLNQISACARTILKKEWNRVKTLT